MSLLLVNIDDPFLQAVAARLDSRQLIAGIFTVSPERIGAAAIKAPTFDSRLLYRAADVAMAMPGIEPATLARTELLSLLECERHFLIATDRTTYAPVSVKERKRLFRELVRHFLGFFRTYPSVKTVFFESTPHMGWDIVLFYVARLEFRRTLILTRTLLADRVMLIEDFRQLPPLALDPVALDEELSGAINGTSAWNDASQVRNANALRPDAVTAWQRRWLEPVRLLRLTGRPARFVSALAAGGPATPTEVETFRAKHRAWARQLRRAYDTYVGTLPKQDYVYFALHFQPERTTQPEGLEFEDQLLALDILSRALPSDISIVIKEHPRQFELRPLPLRLRHARTPLDYEEIARIPRVIFAPLTASTQSLLAQCRMAATITGSTGWEALRLGKPAVVFSACWYAGCEAVAWVGSVADGRAKIPALLDKSVAQVHADTVRFVARLSPSLLRTTNAHAYAERSPINYDKLVATLADAIEKKMLMPEAVK